MTANELRNMIGRSVLDLTSCWWDSLRTMRGYIIDHNTAIPLAWQTTDLLQRAAWLGNSVGCLIASYIVPDETLW